MEEEGLADEEVMLAIITVTVVNDTIYLKVTKSGS